jgi:hypothetical protein
MLANLSSSVRNVLVVGAILFGLYVVFGNTAPSGPQSADMGEVLDRTEAAMNRFESFAQDSSITSLDDAQVGQFTEFLALSLNAEPRFYDKTFGIELQPDASFVGFNDDNLNSVQDAGETKLFTLEIDSANNRLIATDETGTGAHRGFSGTGLMAGMLLGNLMSRQSAAGVRPGSFNNRQTTARSAYKAPASARSRARTGGFSVGK